MPRIRKENLTIMYLNNYYNAPLAPIGTANSLAGGRVGGDTAPHWDDLFPHPQRHVALINPATM
jgi:hypothetical protein